MAKSPDPSGIAPRRAALRLLAQIMDEGKTMSELVVTLGWLAPEDRARAQRLTLEVCRAMGRADRVLKPYLTKRPKPPVMNMLRLGVVEMAAGAAPHGVVNAMVNIAGRAKPTQSAKGLINAVLRKAAEDLSGWDKLPIPTLPRWLRRPLVEAWGQSAVQWTETAHLRGAPLDLTPKSDADAVATATGGRVMPTGSVRLDGSVQVTDLPGYQTGDWWVQDAAAAIPVRMLAPQVGERVLDLCAAPGGKTMQMAAAGADVTAVDFSEHRMAKVAENLDRVGLTATLVTADARSFAEDGFDAILLDAPCSATGTIRRHPDLPLARDGAEISGLIALQAELLDHALTLLRPGGRLVFCTCSLLPDEGECQIDEVLERVPGLTVDRSRTALPGLEPDWVSEEGGLRLRPDYWRTEGGMDGFYAACLTKPA